VEIHILTNSLSSTDIPLVHGAYRKYRKPFLSAGIHLYELPSNLKYKLDNWEQDSKSLLHAKVFVMDRELVYVGSFNVDNRSFQLNTELGLLIESPRLAEEISRNFIGNIRNTAYTLELRNGAIRWHRGDGEIFTREPGANPWQNFNSLLGSWLPIEPFL
jgi:putative cardiolipin synthase